MAYTFSNLPPSFVEDTINRLSGPKVKPAPFYDTFLEKFPRNNKTVEKIWENGLQGLDSPESVFSPTLPAKDETSTTVTGWTFITAPENISWATSNSASRVDVFGTNNPPVVAGTRGMRDLTVSNALIEGFSRGVSIEGKVAALEKLMSYGLNTSDGFVSVPAYQLWANNKSYGGSQAYYIITNVSVRETMRDLKGNATRAYVDLNLLQVPAYQVNSGRDQASNVTSGRTSSLGSLAALGVDQGLGSQSKPKSGPGAPKPLPQVQTGSPIR